MGNNIVELPFEDFEEGDTSDRLSSIRKKASEFIVEVNSWCENQGIDTTTTEYKHQAAVIMTQLQIILMGAK